MSRDDEVLVTCIGLYWYVLYHCASDPVSDQDFLTTGERCATSPTR